MDLLSKEKAAAAKVARKPDTKCKCMEPVIRYVTGTDPQKYASLSTGKPEK